MEDTILHGGEKELLELKNILQEKNKYMAVVDSLTTAVEEQRLKIEKRKAEVEKEMALEIQHQRDMIAVPFLEEIASNEAELQKVLEERKKKREEFIVALIAEETKMYKKKKEELEAQRKRIGQVEGVPAFCTSKLFLALFCPRNGKDAMVLMTGIFMVFIVLPMVLYFCLYGGNDKQALTIIYLAVVVIFYTMYLLINNLVKDKYLIGINKLLKIKEELEKLDVYRKKREKELENIPESSLDLGEFDEAAKRLKTAIGDLNKQKELALLNFDSDDQRQIAIGQVIQDKFKQELEQMRNVLKDNIASQKKMKQEYSRFLDEHKIEERYGILQQLEPSIFNQSVIDELIFFLTHSDAENIGKAIIKRKQKLGNKPADY